MKKYINIKTPHRTQYNKNLIFQLNGSRSSPAWNYEKQSEYLRSAYNVRPKVKWFIFFSPNINCWLFQHLFWEDFREVGKRMKERERKIKKMKKILQLFSFYGWRNLLKLNDVTLYCFLFLSVATNFCEIKWFPSRWRKGRKVKLFASI